MLAGIACAPAMVGLVLLALLAPAVLGASRPVASGDAIRTSPLYPVALVLLLLARFWPVLAGEDLSFYLVSTTGPGPRARHWRCTG